MVLSSLKNPFVRDSILPVIAFTTMFLAGLGIWSMLLSIGIGILGVFMRHYNIPSIFVLIGFIYGAQLERLGRISFMANYHQPALYLSLIIAGISSLAVLRVGVQQLLKAKG